MRIIYDTKVMEHNTLEDYGEGSYRIAKADKIAEKVNLDFNVEEDILNVHTKKHFQKVKGHCKSKMPIAEIIPNDKTFEAILSSVRSAIYASENKAFALTRPPGHHATIDKSKGFCFFNNMAIATKRLVNRGKKICIVDIDGHHGDGIEKIFYDDNRVLVCSIYQEGSYPKIGDITNIGSKKGKGYNLRLPLPKNASDDILLNAFDFFKKHIKKFGPDILGISAGFDGYIEDKLLNLNFTLAGYNELGRKMQETGFPIFGVLEGGYHQEVLSCVNSFVQGIEGIKKGGKISYSEETLHNKFATKLSRLEGKLNESSFL